MEEEKTILTENTAQQYKKELKNLIEVERPKVISEIKEAREQGDLKENSEYDAARNKQGLIEQRIKEIEFILEKAEIIKVNPNSRSDVVLIGSTFEAENLNTSQKNKYTIVGSIDANPIENKISNLSPLAKAVLNKRKGDVVEVEAPIKYKVKITKVL